jgi:hypothetical protein
VLKCGFLQESTKLPVTISDLADLLHIDSPNGNKNFAEELISEKKIVFNPDGIYNFCFLAFLKKDNFLLKLHKAKLKN